MSRRKWLILAGMALANVIVLGAMAAVVIRSITKMQIPEPISTATTPPQSRATLPPTWTPTPSATPQPTGTPKPTNTPTNTATPWPTAAATASPTPAPVQLENPSFEGVSEGNIPGWQTGAFINWSPGDDFDPQTSYAAPRFQQALDPRQQIDGATLQINTAPWVKLRAWVFQAVEVEPGNRVQFQVQARGFVKELSGGYILKAGVDPSGEGKCNNAKWGQERIVNQEDGIAELTSPEVLTGETGQVTVCMFAETQFAQAYHAAFFDNARLTTLPPAP